MCGSALRGDDPVHGGVLHDSAGEPRRHRLGRLDALLGAQVGGDRHHCQTVGLDEPVWLPRIPSGDQPTGLRHDERGQIPRRLLHGRTNDATGEGFTDLHKRR